MREELEFRFKSEAEAVSALRKRFHANVVRWAFSTDELWSYHDLRKRGSESSILPGPEGALYGCGYDQSDRPIVLQQFNSTSEYVPANPAIPGSRPFLRRTATKELIREEYVMYRDDVLDISTTCSGKLMAVYQIKTSDRLVIQRESFEEGFYSHVRYQYEGRRKKLEQTLSDTGKVTFEITYGPHGEQTFCRVRRDGMRFQLGEPLPKGVTVKSLKETIHNRLVALVSEVAARAGIEEPIYCVILGYDGEGNDVLPPSLAIGLESERQRCLSAHGKDAWQWLWNPAEFHHFEKPHTQFDDDDLAVACDLLNTHLAARDSLSPAVKLVVEAAARLNRIPWPPEIKRTEDFVVLAVDLEGANFRKNMKCCLTPEQFGRLRAKHLL